MVGMTTTTIFFAQLDDCVLCRIYKKSGQASLMMPPLTDYDQLLVPRGELINGVLNVYI
jgi:hypothetical protein